MDNKSVYYMAFDGDFHEFNNYGECIDFITSKKGFHRYKKITNEDERREFIESVYKNSKIYIAIFNREVKQFGNWDDCKKFINTHEGVIYKSFKDEVDAQAFINKTIKKEIDLNEPGLLICYTDISYIDLDKGAIGPGYTLTKNGKVVKKQVYTQHDKHKILNGEFRAVVDAIKYAISIKEPRIIIVYDYSGVENFASGVWKAKKDEFKEYVKEINSLKNKINIDFVHSPSQK